MQLVHFDDSGRPFVVEGISVEIALNELNKLDNDLKPFIQLCSAPKYVMLIRGPDEGRVLIYVTIENTMEDIRSCGLRDSRLKESNKMLSIGYDGGSDTYEIYRTVPIEIAEDVICYYFEHNSITNHGQYAWIGDIKPD